MQFCVMTIFSAYVEKAKLLQKNKNFLKQLKTTNFH